MRIRQHIIVYLLFRRDEGCITYYFRRDEGCITYYFRRNEGCITWFAQQLNDLAHRVKNIVSANVPIETLSKQQWEAYYSATRCYICEKPFASNDTRVRIVISPVNTAVQRIQIVT